MVSGSFMIRSSSPPSFTSARPVAEQDAITGLHFEGDDMALLVTGAGTGGNDFALHRFFLGRIGNDDAACGFFIHVKAAYHHAIVVACAYMILPQRGAGNSCGRRRLPSISWQPPERVDTECELIKA
jgi:hypothetical protein